MTPLETMWFHVCIGGVWAYLDLQYEDCETCGITREQAVKRHPKKNAHIVKKETKK